MLSFFVIIISAVWYMDIFGGLLDGQIYRQEFVRNWSPGFFGVLVDDRDGLLNTSKDRRMNLTLFILSGLASVTCAIVAIVAVYKDRKGAATCHFLSLGIGKISADIRGQGCRRRRRRRHFPSS